MKTILFVIVYISCTFNSIATVFSVNTLSPLNLGTGSTGSLSYCISQANLYSGLHHINFAVSGTIQLINPLPTLSKTIVINGHTAPGYTNTPVVELDGSQVTYGPGLRIQAVNCEIYGLQIKNFPEHGIVVTSTAAHHFRIGGPNKGNTIISNTGHGILIDEVYGGVIEGNQIGTSSDGSTCLGNTEDGIFIDGPTSNDTILNNRISCNGNAGIDFSNCALNVVWGNTIGPTTNNCNGNTTYGILITGGIGSGNTIGGILSNQKNIISGNGICGVNVGSNSNANRIRGNSILCNVNDGIVNSNIAPPVIQTATATNVTGTSLPDAIIDIYRAQLTNPTLCSSTPTNQGGDYLGTVTASSTGAWTANGFFSGYVVATQTITQQGTSAFSSIMNTNAVGALNHDCSGSLIITDVDFTSKNRTIVYPNPSETLVYVNSKSDANKRLYDSIGNVVWEGQDDTISIQNLNSGVYYLRIGNEVFGIIKR